MKDDKPKRPPFHVEFAEKIIERLKEGTAPWQKPWEDGGQIVAPHNPVSGTVYRGVNRVGLALSGYDDPRWMTYKQAQEAGYQVQAGSKSTPVVFYQWTREKDKMDENGNPVLGEDGKPEKVHVYLDRPIVRFAHVFNAEQIDGDLPPLSLTKNPHKWEPLEKAESILAASGSTIKHDQSNRAFYRPLMDEIHLPPKVNFDEPGKYYATALHELGHWTGHESRLNREGGPFGSEPYAKEELRAEIASWMLGQDIGVRHDPDQHVAYVASWIKALEEDPSEIMRACRDAEQIKEYVLGLERDKELGDERVKTPEVERPDTPEPIAAMGTPDGAQEQSAPSRPAPEKTWLSVPYREKEQAKSLGAKWDTTEKSWYAPKGADLAKLAAWLPEHARGKAPEPASPEPVAAMGVPEPARKRLRKKFGWLCRFGKRNRPNVWAQSGTGRKNVGSPRKARTRGRFLVGCRNRVRVPCVCRGCRQKPNLPGCWTRRALICRDGNPSWMEKFTASRCSANWPTPDGLTVPIAAIWIISRPDGHKTILPGKCCTGQQQAMS